MMHEYSIAVKSPGSGWSRLGSGATRGLIAEDIQHTHGKHGPESFQCTIRRENRGRMVDELPFTEIATYIDNVPAWSGRIMRTPKSYGDDSTVTLVGEGWFTSHLQDYPIDREWVVTDLSRWQDTRSWSSSLNLAQWRTICGVNADGGSITLQWSANGQPYASPQIVGVTLDLGANNTAKRIVVGYQSSANSANVQLFARTHTGLDPTNSAGTYADAISAVGLTTLGASGTTSGTFATGQRYVTLFLWFNNGAATAAADYWIKFTSIQLFTDAADESGGASILKASTVITEALANAPKISTDTSGITTTSFNIPAYGTGGRRSILDVCNDVNAYHMYQFFGTNELRPRPIFRPVPTVPTWLVDESRGYKYDDAGANEASEIYNTVIMQYQDASGIPAEYVATTSHPLLSNAGYDRAKVLQARSPMTAAAAQQIATAYLNVFSTSPFKGTVSVQGEITAYTGGASVPVGLIGFGDAVVLSSEIDPDTGAFGRVGIIQKATYNHNEKRVELELDSSRNYMDAVLERLAIVTR